MPKKPVQEAIAAWQSQQITGAQLMRRLLSYREWLVPVSRVAEGEPTGSEGVRLRYSEDPGGIRRFYLFSDADAYAAFCQATGESPSGALLLTADGAWAINALPLDQFDYVEIDPASPWRLSYGKQSFPALAAMAQAVQVEQALVALRAGEEVPNAFSLVLDYPHYLVVLWTAEGRTFLALAPDDRDRRLLAIFTHRDAVEAFLEGESEDAKALLSMLELSGRDLFSRVAAMTALDGMVFNCRGPARPVAFALPFAELVLENG
ncbi:MAG: hypothetical protein NZ528_15790 [Caldilineales bacterium]|nr:hypothetical protein [Caldilineales bacterium]MDW8316407.1 hypothetical protein [Anaerolineae bacterium]